MEIGDWRLEIGREGNVEYRFPFFDTARAFGIVSRIGPKRTTCLLSLFRKIAGHSESYGSHTKIWGHGRADKTRHDKTKQGVTRQDMTRQDTARQD